MAKVRYRYLPHTADVKFVAFGDSLSEAFCNSALALFDAIADIGMLKRAKSRGRKIRLKLHAADEEELLWRMLQGLLSTADSRGLFCYWVSDLAINGTKKGFALSLTALAKDKDPDMSKFDVKGISKYSMKISRRDGLFRISVVVDV